MAEIVGYDEVKKKWYIMYNTSEKMFEEIK